MQGWDDRQFKKLRSWCDTWQKVIWGAILLLMHHRCAVVFAILFCWYLCPHCTGVFAVLVLASLPLLHCCLCPCCALGSLLLLPFCLNCCCTGVVALIAVASLPLLHWRLCRQFALASIALIKLTVKGHGNQISLTSEAPVWMVLTLIAIIYTC